MSERDVIRLEKFTLVKWTVAAVVSAILIKVEVADSRWLTCLVGVFLACSLLGLVNYFVWKITIDTDMFRCRSLKGSHEWPISEIEYASRVSTASRNGLNDHWKLYFRQGDSFRLPPNTDNAVAFLRMLRVHEIEQRFPGAGE